MQCPALDPPLPSPCRHQVGLAGPEAEWRGGSRARLWIPSGSRHQVDLAGPEAEGGGQEHGGSTVQALRRTPPSPEGGVQSHAGGGQVASTSPVAASMLPLALLLLSHARLLPSHRRDEETMPKKSVTCRGFGVSRCGKVSELSRGSGE